MDNRRRKIYENEMEAQVIIRDMRTEIDLEGVELLKLEFGQPGARVLCTTGTLWVTQQNDPHDHLLKAGQSFTLNRQGIILVQGLPCGKARILMTGIEPLAHKRNCSSLWENPQDRSLEAG
jgi:hypothetical protein